MTILCAAPGRDELSALKRAVVSASWELVGGATSAGELLSQLEELRPDVIVVDARVSGVDLGEVRRARPAARVVVLGVIPGADAEAAEPGRLRDAILGVRPVVGPVGGPGRSPGRSGR